MYAARQGCLSTVRYLVDKAGALVRLVDNRGRTALRCALQTITSKKLSRSLLRTAIFLVRKSEQLDEEEVSLIEEICTIRPGPRRVRELRLQTTASFVESLIGSSLAGLVCEYDDPWHLRLKLRELLLTKIEHKEASEGFTEGQSYSSDYEAVSKESLDSSSCRQFVLQ